MHKKIFVLRDSRGYYYCPPSVNSDCRTDLLKLATQFTHPDAAKTVAQYHQLEIFELTPVPALL